ncbi:MAG: hypothetical protein ACE5M4_12910, partial [Anaerolineales bacterium]
YWLCAVLMLAFLPKKENLEKIGLNPGFGDTMLNLASRAIVLTFVLIGVAGCTFAETPTKTAATTSEAPSSAPTAPAASKRGAQVEAVVYTRTGGFAGTSERWRFFVDGRIIDSQGVEYIVSDTEVADLLDKMHALGFFSWEFVPPRPGSCADCFTYSIDANHDGQSNQLTFVDAQADVPEGIWHILERIQALLQVMVEN